jgi:predicted GH43/DUF377 family glycosyl hydrolase
MTFRFTNKRACRNPESAKNHPQILIQTQKQILLATVILASTAGSGSAIPPAAYVDGRPQAGLRLEARDQGIVLKHSGGPGDCDILGAREAIVFEDMGGYYLHYDGAGTKGWLACLATSKDLIHWEKRGPVLDFGKPGSPDSASAASPWVIRDGKWWNMFYLGTPNVSPAPDYIPMTPYLTLKARSRRPTGPWEKQYDAAPFTPQPHTYYSATASPGCVVKHNSQYLMFFSAATASPDFKRTLSIARARKLDGPWLLQAEPILPLEEQIENSSLYYEPKNKTWFLFTNHIGINDQKQEFTDAVWVYWSKDLNRWDPRNKAVVLDGRNCSWSRNCIGMPSVLMMGKHLALLYDAPGGDSINHMNRDIGLAWLDLPLTIPVPVSK